MGINKQTAKIIIAEHAQRPIQGRILLIGRQTVRPSEKEVRGYLSEFAVPARDVEVTEDQDTRASRKGSIDDRSFFALFSEASFSSLDVTAYEAASIVHDMNEPIPDDLKGQFDFIYNGSCLDNLFNPAMFIRNCSELLAPGGRVIHIEHASLRRGAYLMYSGDWFQDYYAINDYEDCKVFYGRFRLNHNKERWRLSQLAPFKVAPSNDRDQLAWVTSIWPHLVICVAEKGAQSTSNKYPIQLQYRPAAHDHLYAKAYERFAATARYPTNFGAPTEHTFNLRRLFRAIKRHSPLFTRSNLKAIQKL